MFEHERRTRFEGIIAPEILDRQVVTIIGCGAIGSAVGRILAVMGVGKMVLFDFDAVAPVNLGTQGWKPRQVHHHKVDALQSDIRDLNPDIEVVPFARRWEPESHVRSTLTFLCVDTLTARDDILTDIRDCGVIVDTRMGAQTLLIVSGDAEYVASTLPKGPGYEAPCTERATYYCASVAAGFAVAQAVRYLRGLSPEYPRFMVNLQHTDLMELP